MRKNLFYDNQLKQNLEEIAEYYNIYEIPPENIMNYLKKNGVDNVEYHPESSLIRFQFTYEDKYFYTKVFCWISIYYGQCDVAVLSPINKFERNKISNILEKLFEGINYESKKTKV